jgi:replicative DNA helicase
MNKNQLMVQDSIPQSQEAEKAVIGSLIYDNKNYFNISTLIRDEHFYNPVHKKIFKRISQLSKEGSVADVVVLKSYFKENSLLAQIGGEEYLSSLTKNSVDENLLKEYSKVILDLSMRREIIRLGDSVKSQASNPESEKNAFEIAGEAARKANDIVMSQTEDKFFFSPQDAAETIFNGEGGDIVETGYEDIDEKCPFAMGGITIIAARTSQGKTAFCLEMLTGAAKNKQRVDFYSLEMTKKQIATRMVSSQLMRDGIRIPYNKIYQKRKFLRLPKEDIDLIRGATRNLPSEEYMNLSEKTKLTASSIIANSTNWGEDISKRPKMVVIDYMDKVSLSDIGGDLRNDQKIGEFVSIMRDWGKENNICVVVVFQLNRGAVKDDITARPYFEALKNSGDTEQHADTIILIHRKAQTIERKYGKDLVNCPEEIEQEYHLIKNKAEIIFDKNRMGDIGSFMMDCDIATNYFSCENKNREL